MTSRRLVLLSLILALTVPPVMTFGGNLLDPQFLCGGTWEGTWSQQGTQSQGFLATQLVIKSVADGKGKITYKWGEWSTSPQGGVREEKDFEARIIGDKIEFEIPNRSGTGIWAKVSYVLNTDGTLSGRFETSRGVATATLKKRD